jgi:magnesium chelatase family protein
VLATRARQSERLAGTGAVCNGDMDGRLTRRLVRMGQGLSTRLTRLSGQGALSGRGHDRVLRVARTIADLAGRVELREADLDEAFSYRFDSSERLAA